MGSSDLDGRRLKPNISADRSSWRLSPSAAVTAGKIVAPTGMDAASVYIKCAHAANTSPAAANSLLFLARNTVVTADANTPCLKAVEVGLITDVDTNAASIGDPVYLSTAGGFTFTRPATAAVVRQIGTVLVSSASVGVILFDGRKASNRDGDTLFVAGVIIASGAAFGTVVVGTAWNGATVYGTCLQAVPTNATVNAVAGAVTTGTLRIDLTGDPGAGGALVNCILFKGTADVTDA